jgi:hypothetical protein
VSDHTFGEFYDAVLPADDDLDKMEGRVLMQVWTGLVDEAKWQEVRAMPLVYGLVHNFAEDMLTSFQERLAGICTDALYATVTKASRAFMSHIAEIAARFGHDVTGVCGGPVTFTEALSRAGVIEADEEAQRGA